MTNLIASINDDHQMTFRFACLTCIIIIITVVHFQVPFGVVVELSKLVDEDSHIRHPITMIDGCGKRMHLIVSFNRHNELLPHVRVQICKVWSETGSWFRCPAYVRFLISASDWPLMAALPGWAGDFKWGLWSFMIADDVARDGSKKASLSYTDITISNNGKNVLLTYLEEKECRLRPT